MLPSDYYDGIEIFRGEFNQPEPPVQNNCCCHQPTPTYDNFTGSVLDSDDAFNPYPF